jgi:hypothetical protein
MWMSAMRTDKLFFRVDRRRVNLVRFIFEAYEGLAVVTTLDAAKGIVALAVSPGCTDMARSIMTDLSRNIMMEPLEDSKAFTFPY